MRKSLEILARQKKAKSEQADAILTKAEKENRDMSAEEKSSFDALVADVKDLKTRMAGIEAADDDDDGDEAEGAPARSDKREMRGRPIQTSPAVHTKPKRRWSMLRSVRCAFGAETLDGLEKEVHDETVRRSGGRAFKGVAIPTSNDPEIRALMGLPERRDAALTTVTGAGGIFNRYEGFIDLLRSNLVIEALGATMLTGLHGNFGMARQTGSNGFQWVGEGVSATSTNLTLDAVNFSPKLGIASQIQTRQWMMQTSLDADRLAEDDLAAVCALALDLAAIAGTGGAQPVGLLNNPMVPRIYAGGQGGNGGAFTYGLSVDMETAVAAANAANGRLAYLTNSFMRGSLKKQYVGTAGYPLFVYGKGGSPDVGDVNGYPARVTNQVPANLVKGTSNNCSAVIFGNWKDLIVAQWDTGLDLIVDVYTGKKSGAVEITMELGADIHPRHEASFIVCPDALP